MRHPDTPEEYQRREESHERGIFTQLPGNPISFTSFRLPVTLTISEGAEPYAQDSEMLNKLAAACLPSATVECDRLRYVEAS